jgi:tetratricopeptide (TPR) repeat protein
MAALGRFDDAWALAGGATERLHEWGDARASEWPFNIAALEGDYQRAIEYGQEVVDLVTERRLIAFQAGLGVQLGDCLCKLGRFEEAVPYAAFARDVAPNDYPALALQARIHAWDLAEVLLAGGKTGDAINAFEQALDRYGRKKNLAMFAQVQPRLESLHAETNR